MSPEPDNFAAPESVAGAEEYKPPRLRRRWYHRLATLAWIIFCFELGAFLLVYPWMDEWGVNFLSGTSVALLRTYWESPYLRGGISGLGIINIYIALLELFGFLKECFFD